MIIAYRCQDNVIFHITDCYPVGYCFLHIKIENFYSKKPQKVWFVSKKHIIFALLKVIVIFKIT